MRAERFGVFMSLPAAFAAGVQWLAGLRRGDQRARSGTGS